MSLIAKWKRRRPGIYLVRTDRHIGRGRHNGYVGESVNWELRKLCHLGECRHKGHEPKDWTDLNPRWHCWTLPWWMGFKWVLRPLEWLAIRACWPVYNDKSNRWNPRRVPLGVQRVQRAARDRARVAGYGWRAGLWQAARYHVLRPVYAVVGVLLALAGLWFTR